MWKSYIYFISILLIGTNRFFSLEKVKLSLSLSGSGYFNPSVVIGYYPFNVVDNDLSTCVAMKSNYGFQWFLLCFDKKIEIDEIVIYNGYQKNSNVYMKNNRVKEIIIKGYQVKPFAVILSNHYTLLDQWGPQRITFPQSIFITGMDFTILSTYPGTAYEDTCISEIEFWCKGQKYEIADLEKSRREFLANWREERLRSILGTIANVYDREPDVYVYFGSGEIVEVESPDYFIHDMVRKNMEARGVRELSWTNRGNWVLSWRLEGGKLMYRLTEVKGGVIKNWQEIRPVKKVGEWEIDKSGTIFIREVGGQWEMIKPDEWLTKKYGKKWEGLPDEAFSDEFSANDAGSELQIGDRGVKIYPLVELWKQGKLKVPER